MRHLVLSLLPVAGPAAIADLGAARTWVPSAAHVLGLIDHLGQLAGDLAQAAPGTGQASELLDRFHIELAELRGYFEK